MSNAGTSIRIAVRNNDANIMDVVLEALAIQAEYFGFYFDDVSEEWNFWTSDTDENTASNCYYTKSELHNLLEQYAPMAA